MYVIIFHCHLIYFSFFTILSTLLVLSHYELVSQLWNTWNFTNLYERSHTNKVWLIDWMVRTVKNQKVDADVVEGARNSSTCFLSGVVCFFFFPSSKYWILFFGLSFILAEDSCLYTEAGGVTPSLLPALFGLPGLFVCSASSLSFWSVYRCPTPLCLWL